MFFFLQTDDSNGDLDPGVLLTAQTITSETTSSTTTTQITKVTNQLKFPSGIHGQATLAASLRGPWSRSKGFQLLPTEPNDSKCHR